MFIKFFLGGALVAAPLAVLSATPAGTAPSPGTNSASTAVAFRPGNSLSSLFPDTVVARAKGGLEVKRSQLDEEVIRVKANLAASGQPTLPPDRMALLEQGVLDQIVSLKLLQAKANDEDRATGKALAEKRYETVKTQLGDDKVMDMKLKAESLTREELIKRWTEQATAETVVKREIKVNVTDDQVKKFYDENPGRFEQPEMVRASHILLTTRDAQQKELTDEQKAAKRKKLEDILKRARAGEDFAALAKEFSEDEASKAKGGEYTFARGRMVPEFEAAAFSLQPGQISDIVTTSYGYHIIKLQEKIPAKKVELDKVAKDVKEGLAQMEIQKQLPAYMKKLKADAGLEILDEKLIPPDRTTNAVPSTAAK